MRTSELNEIRKLPLQKRMYLIEKTILSINLDPVIGAEMKKTRPAVIVSDNFFGKLPLKIIVPITDWKDRYNFAPWMVNLIPDIQNGLCKDSSADCFQIRSISKERFVRLLGKIPCFERDKSSIV